MVQEKLVMHVPEMGSFMVQGSRDKYAVTLFPKEKCQCPSTGTCYHILAAKMSIGLTSNNEKNTVSLSQLKRNSRKRVDKKGGRKKPRANDYEKDNVNPAPDSSRLMDFTFDSEAPADTTVVDEHKSSLVPVNSSTPCRPRGILCKSGKGMETGGPRVKFGTVQTTTDSPTRPLSVCASPPLLQSPEARSCSSSATLLQKVR